MTSKSTLGAGLRGRGRGRWWLGLLALVTATAHGAAIIEEIVVTAQKRAVGLQEAPLSVSAFTGEMLEKDRILDVEDLAKGVAGFSITALSPFDQELNIRGVTNTRLDSPTAVPSVGIFLDEVYVGRTGLLNTDFYDIERIEVIRGPQGVLLGRNVIGGALSIITARPEFDTGASLRASAGNLDSRLVSGHVTGAVTDNVAARLSVQARQQDGFAKDRFSDRDLHDINSFQLRGQLLYRDEPSDLEIRLIADYTDDTSNGVCPVGIDGGPGAPGPKPWSTARSVIGGLDRRECFPETAQYADTGGDSVQNMEREAWGLTLAIDKGIGDLLFSSITGYRDGDGSLMYSQTGLGPDGPGVLANGLVFTFDFPVNEFEEITQFSQEFRLASNYTDSPWDWIVGGYYQKDEMDKFDRFWGEIILPVPNLSGESHWFNRGEQESVAVFAQAGYRFNEQWKVSAGLRWTRDDKTGNVSGLAVRTGDKFNPGSTVPLTPLSSAFTEGEGYQTDYGEKWDEVTPQAIVEWTPSDDLLVYLSYSEGFKGGGFQDTPFDADTANIAYEPEEVKSWELGFKSTLLGGRLVLNAAVFDMDYKNLQVEQTNDQCLCNIVENASDASIRGIEVDVKLAPIDHLLISASGTLLDTEYDDFVIVSGGNVVQDNTGNTLQRTPEKQFDVGFDYTAALGDWGRALNLRLRYAWQGKLYWAPTNLSQEDSFGLLDGRVTLALPNQAWSLSVWGKNLTDKTVRSNVIEFLGDEMSLFRAPRTYGVDFTWDFAR
jgi:iron complex outermembrane recepter protein